MWERAGRGSEMTPGATLVGQRAAFGAYFAKALNFRGTQRLLGSLAKPAERQLSILLDRLSTETPIPRSSQTTLVTDSSITKPLPALAVGISLGARLGAGGQGYVVDIAVYLAALIGLVDIRVGQGRRHRGRGR